MPTHESHRSPSSSVLAGLALLAVLVPVSAFGQGDAESGPGAEQPDLLVAAGPDVTVFQFTDIGNYGSGGGFVGYSVGTRSCNRGTTPLNWCDQAGGCAPGATTHDHPVIAQNLYRLKDSRFEQIGMSWLKHGFLSTNSNTAGCAGATGQTCTSPPAGSNQLGVGCTDPYGSGLNGSRPLGMRSEVNATSGAYPFPFTSVAASGTSAQRIQVATTDVDPALNPGALYFAEAQYIAPDDALAGNALNNASYRRVTVGAAPGYNLAMTGSMVELLSAVHAWKANDATVEIFNEDFCSAPVERFEVARKVTDLGAGAWHYVYAVRNMNSDHAAQSFSVDLPDGTAITNVGFHDVDSHSGEPYSTTDWTTAVDLPNGTVSWSSETFAANNNANALRWATMFTFWFDANVAPAEAQHDIGTFKPLAVANAGPSVAICAGEVAHLGTPGVVGQTYLWSPGGATTAQIDVSPASTTDYTVTATSSCASAEDSVTVTVTPLLATPALVGPADGAVDLQLPVSLTWTAVAGATDYTLEIASDAGFTQIVDSRTLAATQAEFANLDPIQHFWRVKANGTCSSAPSTVFDFAVSDELFMDGFNLGDSSAWSQTVP